MSASVVSTAITMNAEGVKFAIKQANESLKKACWRCKAKRQCVKANRIFKEIGSWSKSYQYCF